MQPRLPKLALALALAMCLLSLPFEAARAGAIHDAARVGDTETINRLLAGGTDVNEPDDLGETALLSSGLAGKRDTSLELIRRGADVSARNNRGLTPLHAATYAGHFDVVKVLIANRASVSDAENRFRVTPLHLAAEENHTVIVELLLGNGADLGAKDVAGYTPFSLAVFKRNEDSIALLRRHGASCQPEKVLGPRWFAECNNWIK
jgi:uncharacterized protein